MNNAEQIVAALKKWNSREHQAKIRLQTNAMRTHSAEKMLHENRKLVERSKEMYSKLNLGTENLLDRIALMRLIVKEILNAK